MNDKGDTRDDLRIPEGELGQKIREEFGRDDITVIVSANKSIIRVHFNAIFFYFHNDR